MAEPPRGDEPRGADPDVAFVATVGNGSLDLYARSLAERLPVRTLYTDAYERIAGSFNVSPLSRRAARDLAHDVALVRRLRRVGSALHLPNQHLGRYGRFLRAPYVITVHDLIRLFDMRAPAPLIHRPNWRDRALLALDYAGVRRAAGVIAVSHSTKRDVVEHLAVPEDRIAVVYPGVERALFRPVERRLFDFPYVLFVGSEHPRKNLGTLLRAFRYLAGERPFRELRLVKVGAAGRGGAAFRERTERAVRDLGLDGRVVLTGRLSDEELAACYSGAGCLALPSFAEGFGLPPLEAMACGCPVVVSDRGGLPEAVGDAGLIVDPQRAEALASALREALDPRAAVELRRRGLERASRFSWERTATETMNVYERFRDALARGRR